MPCDYKDYPENWKQIVKREKLRTENRCEMCGVKNGVTVYWKNGMWNAVDKFIQTIDGMYKTIKIVLTVHHIDGDKKNNKYPNLLVACQRHHLRLDLGKHMKKAKETRNKNKKRLDK